MGVFLIGEIGDSGAGGIYKCVLFVEAVLKTTPLSLKFRVCSTENYAIFDKLTSVGYFWY